MFDRNSVFFLCNHATHAPRRFKCIKSSRKSDDSRKPAKRVPIMCGLQRTRLILKGRFKWKSSMNPQMGSQSSPAARIPIIIYPRAACIN